MLKRVYTTLGKRQSVVSSSESLCVDGSSTSGPTTIQNKVDWFHGQAMSGIDKSRLETGKGAKWSYPRKSPCSSIPVVDDTFAPMEVRVAVVSRQKAIKKQQSEKQRKSGNNDPFNQVYG